MSTRYVSLIDLLSFPESKEVVLSEDIDKLENLLYSLGLEVYSYGYTYQVCWHRPLISMRVDNNPVYSGRWVSEERNDKEWVNSLYCSEEKRMEVLYLKDKELVKDIESMRVYPNPTLDIMNNLEEHWGFLKEGNRE